MDMPSKLLLVVAAVISYLLLITVGWIFGNENGAGIGIVAGTILMFFIHRIINPDSDLF